MKGNQVKRWHYELNIEGYIEVIVFKKTLRSILFERQLGVEEADIHGSIEQLVLTTESEDKRL